MVLGPVLARGCLEIRLLEVSSVSGLVVVSLVLDKRHRIVIVVESPSCSHPVTTLTTGIVAFVNRVVMNRILDEGGGDIV